MAQKAEGADGTATADGKDGTARKGRARKVSFGKPRGRIELTIAVEHHNALALGLIGFIALFFALNRALGYSLDSYIPYLLAVYLAGGVALRVDSRIAIGIALLLLAYTPFILIGGNEAYANQIAIYAYYFLVIGVVQQFAEYLRENKK